MSELTPYAKRLLAQLRNLDDPSLDERAQGDAAVRRMLQAQGLRHMPPLAAPGARETVAARSGALAKLAWLAGTALIATVGLWSADAFRSSRPATAEQVHLQPRETPKPQEPARQEEQAPAKVVVSRELSAKPVSVRKRHERHDKAAESTLADELRFVASVDADIRAGDFERALRRLEQHHGPSVLHEERAAMRVLALCGTHDGRAMREREHFLKVSPSSVLNTRVRAACAGATTP